MPVVLKSLKFGLRHSLPPHTRVYSEEPSLRRLKCTEVKTGQRSCPPPPRCIISFFLHPWLEYPLHFNTNRMICSGELETSTIPCNNFCRNDLLCAQSNLYKVYPWKNYHVGRLRWSSDLLQNRRRGIPGRYCQLGQGLCRDLQVLPSLQSIDFINEFSGIISLCFRKSLERIGCKVICG